MDVIYFSLSPAVWGSPCYVLSYIGRVSLQSRGHSPHMSHNLLLLSVSYLLPTHEECCLSPSGWSGLLPVDAGCPLCLTKIWCLLLLAVVFPAPVHLASMIPRRLILNWCISWRTCASLPVWYSVLTFQHPMLIKVLGVRRSAVEVKTSLRVWSPSFINPVACSASLLPPGAVFSLVSVSVARLFLRGGVAGHTPNLPLFSGLGTGRRFSERFQAKLYCISP